MKVPFFKSWWRFSMPACMLRKRSRTGRVVIKGQNPLHRIVSEMTADEKPKTNKEEPTHGDE